jgi:hypothetical protein
MENVKLFLSGPLGKEKPGITLTWEEIWEIL